MRRRDCRTRRSIARQACAFAMVSLGGALLFACEFVTHGPEFESAPTAVSGDCPGATKCGDSCVTLDSDPAHCGACGAACPGGFCVKSVCMNQCPPPSSICGGRCVDLTSDLANCGACAGTIGAPAGTGKCPPDKPLCATSRCAASCPEPLTVCGHACVDTSTNPLHCGSCSFCASGAGFVPGSGVELCSSGKCVLACNSGLTNCNNTQCVDVATDPLNCGFCNYKCPVSLNATTRCVASRCCAAGSTGCL